MMLKRIMRTFFFFFLFLIYVLFIPISIAQLPKPQTTIGDYWNYNGNYMGTNATCKIIIKQRTNITVKGLVYDVFVSVATIEGKGPRNASLYRVETAYFRVLDGAIVKVTDYFNYSSDDLTQTYSYEYIYSPALNMMQYPIFVGEKWENTYNITTIDLLSGSSSETLVNESYECEKITSEFEMNKTFECYVIKKTENIQNQYYDTRYYLSKETGSEPVRLDVEYNGLTIVSLRIISYNVGGVKEKENKTPGYELILLILVVFFIIYLKRKR